MVQADLPIHDVCEVLNMLLLLNPQIWYYKTILGPRRPRKNLVDLEDEKVGNRGYEP
jgi:hypothetical protein